MFREQLKYIRSYLEVARLNRWYFALSIISAFLYKIANVARPFVAALIIKELTEMHAYGTYFYIGVYILIYIFYRGMLFFNWRIYSRNISYCYLSLQDRIFDKLISVDQNFSRRVNRGKLLNVINEDLFEIGEMNDEIAEFFTTIVQIAFVVIISCHYNVWVSMIMIISAILFARARTVHDRKFNFFWWKSQIENDKYSDFLNQILTGLQEVKVFNMLSSLYGHLARIQKRYDKSYSEQRRQVTARDNDVRFGVYFFRALILAICIVAMINGHMEIDILILLYSYHQQLIEATRDFTDATIDIRLNNAAVVRVKSILNYKVEKDTEFGTLNLDHVSGSLQFKNVSLRLNGRTILRNLNFKIRPHEFVAIVGLPGSGKTKLFDLILRLNQPTRGKILLDNIDINEFSREIFAANVSVANQVPFIFNTTIRKNLNFVDTNIKHQIEACKTAGIHDYIETLPLGYNTVLRENGGNISGGQRQMISIARTILTNAEVFLLDDVTTSLDPDTAKLVPQLISKIKTDRTVIMITKKPELMAQADRVIVLDQGKIVDVGTHEKLLERSALYRSLQMLKSLGPMEGITS